MTFRDELEAAEARARELERVLAERDRTIAELDQRRRATLPTERHAIRERQLETAVAEARRAVAEARRQRARPGDTRGGR